MAGNIRAQAGNRTAGINAVRPTWADMHKYYPGENISSASFYPMISKDYERAATTQAGWANTCATRMSYALNYSGIRLAKAPNNGSIIGTDKYNYWIRVKDLKKYLKDKFRGGDESFSPKKLQFSEFTQDNINKRAIEVNDGIIKKISNRHGIIVFDVEGWSDATGHFTLWDGKDLVYVGPPGDHNNQTSTEYYFWFIRPYKDPKGVDQLAQTTNIIFWELK